MKWIQERDALIAQTMAFVQSVTGGRDGPPAPEAFSAGPASAKIAVEDISDEMAPPPAAPPSSTRIALAPRPGTDFRVEMQARIANFRKHQERFERERAEYCSETLTKLRAAIRDAAPPQK